MKKENDNVKRTHSSRLVTLKHSFKSPGFDGSRLHVQKQRSMQTAETCNHKECALTCMHKCTVFLILYMYMYDRHRKHTVRYKNDKKAYVDTCKVHMYAHTYNAWLYTHVPLILQSDISIVMWVSSTAIFRLAILRKREEAFGLTENMINLLYT